MTPVLRGFRVGTIQETNVSNRRSSWMSTKFHPKSQLYNFRDFVKGTLPETNHDIAPENWLSPTIDFWSFLGANSFREWIRSWWFRNQNEGFFQVVIWQDLGSMHWKFEWWNLQQLENDWRYIKFQHWKEADNWHRFPSGLPIDPTILVHLVGRCLLPYVFHQNFTSTDPFSLELDLIFHRSNRHFSTWGKMIEKTTSFSGGICNRLRRTLYQPKGRSCRQQFWAEFVMISLWKHIKQ